MDITYEQIIAMLTTRRNVTVVRPMTIHIKKCPIIEEESKGLDEDLVPLFHSVFRREEEQKEMNIRGALPFKEAKTAMPVCNKLFKMNEAVYRCYDCTNHQAAVLCITCFERGSHHGHRFGKMQSGGGNCDCGNPDAILPQGFCVDHKGTADEVHIQPKVNEAFDHYFKQIFIWILQLYKLELKTESENLLIHMLEVLDELNTQSLFYNTLTNTFLFANDNQVADHILIMGTKAKDGPISKKATQLFLKMFSLEKFKENMALLYLKAYNKLPNFQHTRFQSLFIQLFANNDLVEKVISQSGISLDPRERTYTANSYYSNLVFIGSIKERAARVFYTPIIKNGGVDCNILQNMENSCEKGLRKPEEIYSETINTQNIYYSVNKTILKISKDIPQLMQKQIENQYRQIIKYSFKKNKVVLIYQRMFVMYVFAYFKCDYDRIDIGELCRILKIDMAQMRTFLAALTKHFFNCLKEYGRCIGHIGPNQYSFENYVDLYVRSSNGNRIITLDMIGLKFCAIAHQKIKRVDNFTKVFLDCYQEELKEENLIANTEEEWQSDSDGQESPKRLKSRQKAVVFFSGWINTINLIIESLLYDRAEICLINDIEIKDVAFHADMYQNQFKKLMLNVREISMHEIEAMGVFWFSKPIDKAVISKFAAYDKNKKKFTVKEDVTGVPIKRQLCKSFTKAPDHFMRASDQLQIEVTDQTRRWREIFFSPTFLHKIYHGLISHLHSALKKDFQKYLKDIASHLRVLNLIFEADNELLEETIDIVINLAEKNEKLKAELVALFRTEGRKDSMEENVDKEKMDKRKELLKKKKEEKLKMLKSKINVEKYLNQNKEEDNQNQTCIICHEQNSQSPLFYMASTFLSNITYSVLKTEGINPFFISCFHQVHEKCFQSLLSDVQRVACPLCKAYTNIILPTEQSINDPNVLKVSTEKMEVAFALQYKKSFDNLYVEILKSFVQLFFSAAIEEGMINQRQIKIYKIIFWLVRIHFQGLSNEQKEALENGLVVFASKYEKESNERYNLGLLMDFVFTFAIRILKKEKISEQVFKEICQHCRHLPRADLLNCNNLANKLFDLSNDLTSFFNQSMDIESSSKELRSFIYQFDPPKSIRALLQQRRKIQQQKICKMGHPICICLICAWKGCHDCNSCTTHSRQVHNYDCLYFNFITGGFHHQYNKIQINIRSLYVNELGVPWKPKFQDDAYFFQIDIYQKLSQALRSGNLIQMVRSNYEQLRVRDNGVWII